MIFKSWEVYYPQSCKNKQIINYVGTKNEKLVNLSQVYIVLIMQLNWHPGLESIRTIRELYLMQQWKHGNAATILFVLKSPLEMNWFFLNFSFGESWNKIVEILADWWPNPVLELMLINRCFIKIGWFYLFQFFIWIIICFFLLIFYDSRCNYSVKWKLSNDFGERSEVFYIPFRCVIIHRMN